jgi:enoyl-CoA hydratase
LAETEAQAMGTTITSDLIQYETDNGIAVLTLNDPPANTYTHEMMLALDSAILRARMDEGVQVIVITGNGEKFFCAGANINMLQSVTPTFKYYFCLHANETLSRFEQRLLRIVGKSKAIELMATAELFPFERGLELGLVNQIFDAETGREFMRQVQEYAAQFTTPNKAAGAVGRIKRSVQTGAEIPFEAGLALERELQQQLFQSEDAKEGLDAYVNKRKPEFKGK